MNPFNQTQTESETSLEIGFTGRLAPIALVLALVAGLGVVWWKAERSGDSSHRAARREAMARVAALDAQFTRALGAVQTLSSLARQGGGTVASFQRTGTDLMAVWPGLAWMDLEPGGVVSEVVPRAGHERLLGANVLKDPAQRASALEASQRSGPAPPAPVALAPGDPGLVVRAPILLRGRDGRDFCSGYVAVAFRFRADELAAQGYDYVLYRVNPFPPRQTVILATRGRVAFPGAELQSAQAQNVTFYLALQPRAGWVSKTSVALECLAVLLISGLIWLALHLLETGRAMERSLGETNRRLARVNAERKQAQDALVSAQDELKRVRAALQKAESVAADVQARAEAAARTANEAREHLQTKLSEAESDSRGLQARLEGAAQSLAAKQDELDESQAALQAAQAAAQELQGRLDVAADAAREAGRLSEAAMARAGEWEERTHRLDARLVEADAARQARAKEHAAALAELQSRLEMTTASAREAAEDIAAAVARLDQLEDRNRKLKARLLELEGTGTRFAQATVLLEAAPAEPATMVAAHPAAETHSASTPEAIAAPPAETEPEVAGSTVEPHEPPSPPIASVDLPSGPVRTDVEPPVAPTSFPEPVAEAPVSLDATPPESTGSPAPLVDPAPPAGQLAPLADEGIALPAALPVAQPGPAEVAEVAVAAAEELARRKPAKAGRPKKVRRDDLFDFFSAPITDEGANGAMSFGPAFEEDPVPGGEGGSPDAESPLDNAVEKPSRPPRGALPVNPALLRKAINQILPLFAGEDPGAKDCLKDNRATFRSAFAPEAFAEFEQTVKAGDFAAALDHLKKAARRHGIAI